VSAGTRDSVAARLLPIGTHWAAYAVADPVWAGVPVGGGFTEMSAMVTGAARGKFSRWMEPLQAARGFAPTRADGNNPIVSRPERCRNGLNRTPALGDPRLSSTR